MDADGETIPAPPLNILTALVDDDFTAQPARRIAYSRHDLTDRSGQPWWAIAAAGRRLQSRAVPLLWRRCSVSVETVRVIDVALMRAADNAVMERWLTLATRMALESPGSRPVAVTSLPISYPSRGGPTPIQWAEAPFVECLMATWWPGWRVRLGARGGGGSGEAEWTGVMATGRELTFIAAPP